MAAELYQGHAWLTCDVGDACGAESTPVEGARREAEGVATGEGWTVTDGRRVEHWCPLHTGRAIAALVAGAKPVPPADREKMLAEIAEYPSDPADPTQWQSEEEFARVLARHPEAPKVAT